MTREEIWEGLYKEFEYIYKLKPMPKSPETMKAFVDCIVGGVFRYLDSKGVVIKVKRELPEGGRCYGDHSIWRVPMLREEIIFHTQQDMLKAGCVAVDPLIGE